MNVAWFIINVGYVHVIDVVVVDVAGGYECYRSCVVVRGCYVCWVGLLRTVSMLVLSLVFMALLVMSSVAVVCA